MPARRPAAALTVAIAAASALCALPGFATPAEMRAKFNSSPQFQQADRLVEEGHAAPARAILQKLGQSPQATPEMLSRLADTYLNDLEIDDAGMNVCETSLSRAIKIDPGYGRAYKNLAKLKNLQEDYKSAVSLATRALQAKAPDKAALRQRALAYDKLHQGAAALADITEFIGAGSTDPRDYLIQASILENLKRYDEAISAYNKAQKLKFSDGTCTRIVAILEKQEKYPQAIKAVSELITLNAADAHAYQLRARLQEKAKNNKAALADLSKAISLEPAIALYKDRAALYTKMGQSPAAQADLKMIEKLGSRDF
ncbi:MAG: hypothetical protein JSS83_04655 [Cyanobacteria bacterium SZAS LIN-3]|nr:hypothetical protein [Cyanobacteria bacterium SZAS LIN-3]